MAPAAVPTQPGPSLAAHDSRYLEHLGGYAVLGAVQPLHPLGEQQPGHQSTPCGVTFPACAKTGSHPELPLGLGKQQDPALGLCPALSTPRGSDSSVLPARNEGIETTEQG